jgi:hypothetical protein
MRIVFCVFRQRTAVAITRGKVSALLYRSVPLGTSRVIVPLWVK